MLTAVLVLVALGGCVLGLMATTVTGARRRGSSWPSAVVSGAFFPAAWVAWYVADGPDQD